MAPVTPSPPGFSPNPTISITDPTPIEEGKTTPSSQASTVAIAISTINAPKVGFFSLCPINVVWLPCYVANVHV